MQTPEYFQLRLGLPVSHGIILQGLDRWFDLGLISELTWRSLPQEVPDRQIYLTVIKDKYNSDALFAGITAWVEFGLLDDEQVRNICAKHLISLVPDRVVAKTEVKIEQKFMLAESESLIRQIPPVVSPRQSTVQTAISRLLQALFSEFSTLWLLFLGVFLTVVSSGLLAASQWQNFSAIGQYLILFAYTLGFWGVSFVTEKKARLSLTTETLQLVTLLLVPANFWAIDGLGLLDNAVGIGLGAIAGLILSGVTVFLLQTSFRGETSNRQYFRLNFLTVIAILLLGWMHLGWGLANYPLIAVYVGIGGVATAKFFNHMKLQSDTSIPLAKIVSTYGMILLVGRGFLFGVSIAALGLAIAICGWVLCQVDNRSKLNSGDQELSISNQTNENRFEAKLGQILLLLGWLATIGDSYPWQAIAVSLLITWLICDRLHQSKSPSELTKLFFWSLQILWLVGRLIPDRWHVELAQFFQLSNYELFPLIGVVLIPYLLLTLGFASIYRHHQDHTLALRSEHLALGFGVFLSVLSFSYPFTRFANLTLSALILGFVMARRSPNSRDNQFLIYTTHIIGLGAIASGIFAFYRLTLAGWAGIWMVMMLVEWSVTGRLDIAANRDMGDRLTKKQIWRESSWQLSLGMAILSYFLIIGNLILRSQFSVSIEFSNYAGLGWLITMAILGLLGMRKSFTNRDRATRFSLIGLVIGQYLTWQSDGMRTFGLAIALIMMLINTRRLSNLFSALITTGFGLALYGSILWQLKPTGAISSITFGINGMVISIILLFIFHHWFRYQRDRLHTSDPNLSIYSVYSQAFDLWTVLLSTFVLSFQTHLALIFFNLPDFRIFTIWIEDVPHRLFTNLFLSTVSITAGLVYRAWQESVSWTEWGIAWGLELSLAGAIALNNGSVIDLAIANLALGLSTQLLGDWYIRRTKQNRYPLSWNVVPLIYAVIGSLLRIGNFSDYTGLLTFGTALVAIGISRRTAEPPKLLIYVAMAAGTFGAYELLLYQMLAAKGDSWGDGLIVLGVLGCAIAYIYQVLARWIMPYLRLSRFEIDTSAHIHWFASAVLLLGGSLFSPIPSDGAIGVGLAITLSIYALNQGRKSDSEAWVYLGIGMGIIAVFYQFTYSSPNLWFNQTILIPYSGAIATGVSTLILLCPWQVWGWSHRPWNRAALVLPMIFVLIYGKAIATPCLLIVAGFYGIRTILSLQIRLSYLSVWLCAWVGFRFISEYSYLQLFFSASIVCSSVLYFSHLEPFLKGRNIRGLNHNLRGLACGSLCLIAFMDSTNDVQMAAITWGLSLGFAIAGLAMRVRAYLFIGTVTFVLLVINQAVLLVAQYGFLLWAIGIVAGISFITVAANFEVRRDRILAIARNIGHELETWA